MPDTVERWDIYAASLTAVASSNPFLAVIFEAEFDQHHHSVKVRAFSDGEDTYRIDIIDTWNMTIDHIAGAASDKVEVELQQRKKYQAVRVVRNP